MKKKIITVILSAILIICIGSSIYQYKTTSNLKSSLSLLANTKNDITTEIGNKTEELKNTTSEIEKFNTTISDLTTEKDSLTTSIKETQSQIDTIQQEIKIDNEIDTANTELTEEDQEIIDQIEQELMKEHPEWFTDTTENTGDTGNYEHVGTPSTGVVPEFNFGQGDYSELGSDVTVY